MSDEIATYTFLPWLRQGIGAKITKPDNLGEPGGGTARASVTITVQVNEENNPVSQPVQLIGPGDVIGINPRAIVRTEPRHWVTDFEPNYLAAVEFYPEDFPWRYTPASAVQLDNSGSVADDPQQTKLRPWIFLLVLEQGEFEEIVTLDRPLPAVRIHDDVDLVGNVFPPAEQAWAWAHVHVSKDITAGETNDIGQSVAGLQALVRSNPDEALSRLLSPRKLNESQAYHAFLVPAFEVGRKAGLGELAEETEIQAASWGAGQREYPVYYRWYFRTGTRGDFEYLVDLLEAREVDPRVGTRDMDMQQPDFGVPGLTEGPPEARTMGLEGALRSLKTKSRPEKWPPDSPLDFLTELAEKVNFQEVLLEAVAEGDEHPEPVISPPLYGRWHALQERLHTGTDGWVNELNQDPRLRTASGFGTQVIRTNQEDYMQRAWQQLGDVIRANQKIRQAQLAIGVSHRMYLRHILPLSPDQQISISQQVHARVLHGSTTVAAQVRGSRLPQAALQPALRKILRPRGNIMRKAAPSSNRRPTDILVRLNAGRITAAPPKRAPKGQISLEEVARSDRFAEEKLSVDTVHEIPTRSRFQISEPGALNIPPDVFDGPESRQAKSFRQALLELHERLQTPLPRPENKPTLDLGDVSRKLTEGINPVLAIPKRVRSFVKVPTTLKHIAPVETIVPVMAHPVFPDPMYKPLRDISSELLIPNLNLIPNNTITLLETNPRFIESYMVGLNHEMARELLWREYVTDQRGSYFRQFWDVSDIVNRDDSRDTKEVEEALRDIRPLHRWGRLSALGEHANRSIPQGNEEGESRLVLTIRGDLLRKYPTAVIFAQKAEWIDDLDSPIPRKIRVLDETNPADNIKEPIFKAAIEPDLRFIGFDLTRSQVEGNPTPDADDPGWFFVIQQRPGEPRFGLDIVDTELETPNIDGWNQLTWNHLGEPVNSVRFIDVGKEPATNTGADNDVNWGMNAADMAYILFQEPVMVAIHAADMLPGDSSDG